MRKVGNFDVFNQSSILIWQGQYEENWTVLNIVYHNVSVIIKVSNLWGKTISEA